MLQPALSALLLNILAIASLFVVLITIYNRVFQITTRLSKPRRICSEPQPFLTKAAVLFSRSGPYTFTYDWPRPQISSREILIRTHAVGLNPIDWKSVSYGFGLHSIPWVSGREAAGTIEEVGEDVQGFCKGDRVAVISTNYRDVRMATFQEYVAAFPHTVCRIPGSMSFEEGATLGVGSVAAAGALHDGLGIPKKTPTSGAACNSDDQTDLKDADPWLLIWGGACVTGMMAIQLAKISGYRVFAVAGMQNAAYLQNLGAEIVVDRWEPEKAIAVAAELHIAVGIDCVGEQTSTYAVRALHPGGTLVYLVKGPDMVVAEQAQIEVRDVLIKRFHEDAAYGQSLMDYISHCLSCGAVRPVRYELVHGGFEFVESALSKLKSQVMSGRKLVIKVDKSN